MCAHMSQGRVGHNLLSHLEQSGCPHTADAVALLNGEPVEYPMIFRSQENMRWVLFRLGTQTHSLECPGATLMREQEKILLRLQELCGAQEEHVWEIGDQKSYTAKGDVVSGTCDLGALRAGNFIVQIREKPLGLAGMLAKRKQQHS